MVTSYEAAASTIAHDDGQVRERLQDPADTAAPTRVKPLEHDRLTNMRLRQTDEIIDVEIVIVLGVGDRRFEALAHVARDALARELQVGQGTPRPSCHG